MPAPARAVAGVLCDGVVLDLRDRVEPDPGIPVAVLEAALAGCSASPARVVAFLE